MKVVVSVRRLDGMGGGRTDARSGVAHERCYREEGVERGHSCEAMLSAVRAVDVRRLSRWKDESIVASVRNECCCKTRSWNAWQNTAATVTQHA